MLSVAHLEEPSVASDTRFLQIEIVYNLFENFLVANVLSAELQAQRKEPGNGKINPTWDSLKRLDVMPMFHLLKLA